MKRAEVQLPEPLYHQVEGLAAELHLSVPDLLCQAAEHLVRRQARLKAKPNGDWRFPEGRRLGPFRAAMEDWRLLANEAAG